MNEQKQNENKFEIADDANGRKLKNIVTPKLV
jgi:hypothetical protein